ncbi:MAG: hypothetical protein ABEJ23_10000 [Haloarculaceae archaeon]
MPHVEITDEILDQLATALSADSVADPNNRFAVQAVATNEELDALAQFVVNADAVRYTRALERLEQRDAVG